MSRTGITAIHEELIVTNRKLQEMVSQARKIRLPASPARANIIDILVVLHDDDLVVLAQGDHLSSERHKDIATLANLSPQIVAASLSKLLALELVDYTDDYLACKDFYLASGISLKKVTSFLQDGFTEPALYFVLHHFIERWAYNRSSYPLIGLGIEDDKINRLCKGYLVSIDLAFQTRIELLAHSFSTQWPNWQVLWQHY